LVPRSEEFEGQSLKVKGQGHQGQKWHFSVLSAACVQFVFDKTSLASSFILFPFICSFSYGHFYLKLEMWANAQRDGRPAKYRWRWLFNTAKFGRCPLLECHARRKTR